MKRTALLVLLVAATPAHAEATLCRTKKGAVVERTACRKRETAVSLAGVGAVVQGEQGPGGASHPNLRAFDANGRFIGSVNASGEVLILAGGRALWVNAGRDGFTATRPLRFAEPLCAGTPFVPSEGDMVSEAVVRGTTAYYAGEPIQSVTFKSHSALSSPEQCAADGGTFDAADATCCSPVDFTQLAGPAIAVDLSGFTPPFRVEVAR